MKRWLTIHRDLGLQLFALYLLLIVPFLITLLVFDRLIGLRIREDVEANDLSLARAIAQETEISIDNALDAVASLAEYPEVLAADVPGMERLFEVTLDTRPDTNLIYRLDEKGIMLYHYPPGPGSTVGTDFSFRDYFQGALLTHDPLISQGRISPTTNQAVATAVMPIWSEDGGFLGLVGVNIKLESLSETLSAIISEHQADEGLKLVILDSSYKVIAYPESGQLLQPADAILPEIFMSASVGDNHSLTADGPDGVERLYTYAPIPRINWGVVVSRPTVAAFGTQIILRQITQVAGATFILIGLFFWGMLTIRVIRPIEQLAPISEAIGLNKPITPEERKRIVGMSKRYDQIGHLIRSILRMEDSIHERIKEQAILLETGTAVVSSLDLQTVLDRILDQMGRLLNVQMYAIIQMDEQHGAFRIRASRGLSTRFTEQLSILPSEPDSVTMRALHAREPIFVSDTETDPTYLVRRAHSRSEGYRAVLAVPLNTQHAPPTALLVFHPEPHEFTYNEIQILWSFANQAAMAIENAILFERSDMRLREQSHRLEALIQSMEDGLILSDLRGRVVYANRRISDLASLNVEELVGMSVERVLQRIIANAQETEKAEQEIQNIPGGDKKRKAEIALDLGGKTVDLRIESFEVLDSRGISLGQGLILQDVTIDREVDRMKSSLVSTVSHELRTPLAAIKGYASTLLAEDVEWDHKSQKEFISVISNETDRLSNLVNNLLDLSRIEAGSLRLSREECQINEMIHRAAKQVLDNGNRFEVQVEADLPPLNADPPRLESILRNLLENSVKYAGPQAIIRIAVERQDSNIVFRVSDNGPGIPSEEAKRIFSSFYRLDDSFSRNTSGAGLGLAICEGLVRAHGGEIWVEPQEVGACIAFHIPIEKNGTAATGENLGIEKA